MWKRSLLLVVLAGSVLTVTYGAGPGKAAAAAQSQSFFSQVSTFGGTGSGAGQMQSPDGVAVQPTSGNVYVADAGNHRVDVFGPTGNFIEAFGWGVVDGQAKAEVCTISCQGGIAGSGPGQFVVPDHHCDRRPAGTCGKQGIRRRCGEQRGGYVQRWRQSRLDDRRDLCSSGPFPEPGRGGPGPERQLVDRRRLHKQCGRVRRPRRFHQPVDRHPRFAERHRRRLGSRFGLLDDSIPIRVLFLVLGLTSPSGGP